MKLKSNLIVQFTFDLTKHKYLSPLKRTKISITGKIILSFRKKKHLLLIFKSKKMSYVQTKKLNI